MSNLTGVAKAVEELKQSMRRTSHSAHTLGESLLEGGAELGGHRVIEQDEDLVCRDCDLSVDGAVPSNASSFVRDKCRFRGYYVFLEEEEECDGA